MCAHSVIFENQTVFLTFSPFHKTKSNISILNSYPNLLKYSFFCFNSGKKMTQLLIAGVFEPSSLSARKIF